MVFKEKLKIGIIVGLSSEKKAIPLRDNLFIENGYGEKAYEAAKNVLKNNIDLIISFGLAGSLTKELKNSEIIIPSEVFDKKLKSIKTSLPFNSYLKKGLRRKLRAILKC